MPAPAAAVAASDPAEGRRRSSRLAERQLAVSCAVSSSGGSGSSGSSASEDCSESEEDTASSSEEESDEDELKLSADRWMCAEVMVGVPLSGWSRCSKNWCSKGSNDLAVYCSGRTLLVYRALLGGWTARRRAILIVFLCACRR